MYLVCDGLDNLCKEASMSKPHICLFSKSLSDGVSVCLSVCLTKLNIKGMCSEKNVVELLRMLNIKLLERQNCIVLLCKLLM